MRSPLKVLRPARPDLLLVRPLDEHRRSWAEPHARHVDHLRMGTGGRRELYVVACRLAHRDIGASVALRSGRVLRWRWHGNRWHGRVVARGRPPLVTWRITGEVELLELGLRLTLAPRPVALR